MSEQYQSQVLAPEARNEPAIWFAFHRGRLLIARSTSDAELPWCHNLADLGLTEKRNLYLGTYGGKHCYVAEIDNAEILPTGHELRGLRSVFGLIDEPLAVLAGRAFQILEWDRNHQYCSRCATPTQARRDERARVCPACGYTIYPPICPAIMVLVTKGREILLARKAQWGAERYSALAGFVEPGETLEDTARRETREEVGIEIKNLRYFGSQPWPFPHSLMVAFTAEYAGGELRPDGVEIAEARWFDVASLPGLPMSISISRRLVDATVDKLARGLPL